MNADMDTSYRLSGFHLAREAIDPSDIHAIREELLSIGSLIDVAPVFDTVDAMWNHYKESDRSKASLLYIHAHALDEVER